MKSMIIMHIKIRKLKPKNNLRVLGMKLIWEELNLSDSLNIKINNQ